MTGTKHRKNQKKVYTISKEMKKIEEMNKHYTALVKINWTKKECIIDTGSPITIMPLDEKILKLPGKQKITNRYQDVNKNKVKFRGKIPEDVEYGNARITKKIGSSNNRKNRYGTFTWDGLFKLTIGRIQLAENSQSERQKVINKFSAFFENNETIMKL